jgi:hypothetical protein
LVQSVAHWDVEVSDLPVIEDITTRWFVEGILIVEDALLKGADLILVVLGCNSSISLLIGDGLKEPVSDDPKECQIKLGLHLKGGLNGMRGEGNWGWRWYMARWELKWGFVW